MLSFIIVDAHTVMVMVIVMVVVIAWYGQLLKRKLFKAGRAVPEKQEVICAAAVQRN